MNQWLERLRELLRERSPRERWGIAAALCVVALVIMFRVAVQPLSAEATRLGTQIEELRGHVELTERLVHNVRTLQSELVEIENKIRSEEKAPLLTLLEKLATDAGLTAGQIEDINFRNASPNERYPETRAEVRLKGATLAQTVDYLFRIEWAPLHLIVRSLRITTRGKDEQVLDVSFSVSSFETA